MKSLYRAISMDELNDWTESGVLRSGTNTLEGKQFFESEIGVKNFTQLIKQRNFEPPYICFLKIRVDEHCLNKINFDRQILDQHMAITIFESDLKQFNACIKKAEKYEF